ncbi:MAG: hypothetical protein AB1715_12250 [Acidobacteriota bacterium]
MAGIKKAAPASILLVAAITASCFPSRPAISPPPTNVETIEGFASLRLATATGTARSKFSFLFRLPDRGRIEVYDPLRRTVSLLFFAEAEAFFVLPGKRAYWRSTREEVLDKLLGFDLRPEELTAILAGRWDSIGGWNLEKDSRGRVARGRRADLEVEVRDFFSPSGLPALLAFSRGRDRGSLKILRLAFNQPLKRDVWRPFFLDDPEFREAAWTEVEKWLREMAAR